MPKNLADYETADTEIKGKFIHLVASLVSLYRDALEQADEYLLGKTGKHWNELDPETWYPVGCYVKFMENYTATSMARDNALVTLGKLIYPKIDRTVGFPPGLTTPLDFIKFEAEGYLANLRGPRIEPRNITRQIEGNVIVRLVMKEQPCKTMEGIYQGMIEMCGKSGSVTHLKCREAGDDACEFNITWNA